MIISMSEHPREKLALGLLAFGSGERGRTLPSVCDNKERALPSCFLAMPSSAGKGNLLSWEDRQIGAVCIEVSSVE